MRWLVIAAISLGISIVAYISYGWVVMDEQDRLGRTAAISVYELGQSIPSGYFDAAKKISLGRVIKIHESASLIVVVAFLIGCIEGWYSRKSDVFRGYRINLFKSAWVVVIAMISITISHVISYNYASYMTLSVALSILSLISGYSISRGIPL